MNHGYDDDGDDDYDYAAPPTLPGPSSLMAQLLGGSMRMGMDMGRFARAPPPSAFDEYYKAYSVAVMGGRERAELMYGGKIIMPPSALAKLSSLDIDSPWSFQLRNPRTPSVHKTHAGVLEFIAEEGIVHLPAWMMKTLNLTEGDPIRLTGAQLPKGKFVKLQAQSTAFLEVSDPKAVLESALRSYNVLSKGDIIEISYNSLTFDFAINETKPEGPGIDILNTDLEVDFDTPIGYVEPARPAPAPIPTMADKLNINLSETHSASAGSSRPGTGMSMRPGGGVGPEGGSIESFTGVGQSLSGKKVKGKGLAKKIEEVDPASRINRHEGPRIITPDSLNDADRKVPAALVLPEGKFFFGFKYIPFDPSKAPKKAEDANGVASASPSAFGGTGQTVARQPLGMANPTPPPSRPPTTQPQVLPTAKEEQDPWANLGGGNTLSGRKIASSAPTATSASAPVTATPSQRPTRRAPSPSPPPQPQTSREVIDATMLDEDDFMYGEEEDDDDDYVIEVDSD